MHCRLESSHKQTQARPEKVLAPVEAVVYMSAAAAAAAANSGKGMGAARRKSLVSRTLERCRSGLSVGGGRAQVAAAGCFSVYVGLEKERFVVRAECANHPLFQRLLDDAEREYGYAAQGPLALPCTVDDFLDVLWHMDHCRGGEYDGGVDPMTAPASPMCGLKGRAAGYRVLSSARTSPASFFSRPSPAPGRKS